MKTFAALRQFLRSTEALDDSQPVKLALGELRALEQAHQDTVAAVDTQMCRVAQLSGELGRLRTASPDTPPAPIDPAQAVLPLSPSTDTVPVTT